MKGLSDSYYERRHRHPPARHVEPVPTPEPPPRCAYNDGAPWLTPCPNPGTHRMKREYLACSPNGTRRWPIEGGLRYCAGHSDHRHEPVPEGQS